MSRRGGTHALVLVASRLVSDAVESQDDVQPEERMSESTYPPPTRNLTRRRAQAAPEIYEAFQEFSRRAFAEGALAEKTKQLIAVAVAHTTQCPYCIRSHTQLAKRHGASEQEIMEAIWVAAEMRAGGSYAHSAISLTTINDERQRHEP
jgi:AhpD family alkylhydroperoxidase